MAGVSDFNVRTFGGISRDQVNGANVGGKFILVMDDPQLAEDQASIGKSVIYRQHLDDPQSFNWPAADAFLAERIKNAPHAAYYHFTNEISPSPRLNAWTKDGLAYLRSKDVRKKGIIYNLATHADTDQWVSAMPNLKQAVDQGSAIGWHAYIDGLHDLTAFNFMFAKALYGGLWIATEFAPALSYDDAHRGWRGLPALDKVKFVRKWAKWFYENGMAACWFAYDFWDQPTVEKAKEYGFGYNDYAEVLTAMRETNVQYPWKGISMSPTVAVPSTGGKSAKITALPSSWRNLRQQPDANSTDVGDLVTGTFVTLFPEAKVGNWMYMTTPIAAGWVEMTGVSYELVLPASGLALTAAQYERLSNAAKDIQAVLAEVKPAPVSF